MTQRLNISIPDELANQLEANKEAIKAIPGGVSKLCADAIRKAIQNMDTMKAVNDSKKDTVARLRASKAKVIDASKREGFEDGSKWLSKHAEYAQVQTIIKVSEGENESLGECLRNTRETAEALEEYFTHLDMRDDLDAEEYWAGFVEGVVDAWGQVEKDVES